MNESEIMSLSSIVCTTDTDSRGVSHVIVSRVIYMMSGDFKNKILLPSYNYYLALPVTMEYVKWNKFFDIFGNGIQHAASKVAPYL